MEFLEVVAVLVVTEVRIHEQVGNRVVVSYLPVNATARHGRCGWKSAESGLETGLNRQSPQRGT